MDFVKRFLEERGAGLAAELSQQLGFSPDQTRRFVPAAVERVMGALRGGQVDAKALLGGGGHGELAAAVDTRALANEAGMDETTASAGLQTLLPSLLGALRGEGAAGLAGLLGGEAGGGLAGALGGLAGGLFKKK